MGKYIIGLSVTYHDPALAIVDQRGEVVWAQASERYLQNKRALGCDADPLLLVQELLPRYCPDASEFVLASNWRGRRPLYEQAVAALGCLSAKGLMKTGIKKLRSPLENYKLHYMIASQRRKIYGAALNTRRIIAEQYPHCPVSFYDYDHHLTHAASACYASPFAEAACAVIDSFGERGSMAFYHFKGQKLHLLHASHGTGSIGFYYMKLTELCGFDWLRGEEWKVMGLAAFGKLHREFYRALKATICVRGFECRHQGKDLFNAVDGLQKFQVAAGDSSSAADIAYTGQYFFAELMSDLLQHLQAVSGCRNLALAGGCALNSAYNGQISKRCKFAEVFVPYAPADDGTALGAAWLAWGAGRRKTPESWGSPYLGDSIMDADIARFAKYNRALKVERLPDIASQTAQLLADGCIVGWIQGRAEFGPRALGNRCILADPRLAATADRINQTIKFRENFRPFAAAVLHHLADDYFVDCQRSPYMDKTFVIKPARRQQIAAVCHADNTARLQTVRREDNPRFHQLISQFHQRTDTPMLLNTSFNVMGKPLVHSLNDALAVFLTSGLDVLVVNDYLISKPSADG